MTPKSDESSSISKSVEGAFRGEAVRTSPSDKANLSAR